MGTGFERPFASSREESEAYLLRRQQAKGIYGKKLALCLGVFGVLFCFLLCLRMTNWAFVPPGQVVKNLVLFVRLTLAEVFHSSLIYEKAALLQDTVYYTETVLRLRNTLMTAFAGAALAVGGALFQQAFRNPIAAPTMLGVSSGVDLGMLLLVLTYSGRAASLPLQQELYCFAGSALVLALVLGYTKIISGSRSILVNLLIAGGILTRVIGEVVTAVQYYMSYDDVLTLQEMLLMGVGLTGTTGILLFGGALLVGFVPLLLLRGQMTMLSLPREEAATMGVNTAGVCVVAILCGFFLVTTCIIHCGNVAMLALMVPHFSRSLFGADFKKLILPCALLGSILLLFCRVIAVYISFTTYSGLASLSTVVSVVTAPLFALILIRGRWKWQ